MLALQTGSYPREYEQWCVPVNGSAFQNGAVCSIQPTHKVAFEVYKIVGELSQLSQQAATC